jgi:hypothetical protein
MMPGYNAEFRQGPLAFFKKYAVSPPDDTSEDPFAHSRAIQGGKSGYNQIAVLKSKRVGYINIFVPDGFHCPDRDNPVLGKKVLSEMLKKARG